MDALIICIFKGMHWKRYRSLLIPLIIALIIKIFSFFPNAVEKYYSTGIYPLISRLQRLVVGWIPFSIGDFIYAICFLYLVVSLVRFVISAFRRKLHKQYIFVCIKRWISIALWTYLVFNILWGLNYDRLPIARQMKLEAGLYSKEELSSLVALLVSRMNGVDSISRIARKDLTSNDSIFRHSIDAYHKLGNEQKALFYPDPSVKFSFYGYLANYLGFSGYYNPFSGEAQVNTTVPRFVQPFTTCHEIGHQLGYAKEEEANFCGFLATQTSRDPAFRYSMYVDLYLYSAGALYALDSTALIPYRESVKPDVRQDIRDLKAFYQKYQNPFEPVIHALYGKFLKANRQPQGIYSYDEVVGLAVAYYRKYGPSAF
ncbi:MAG: DUF3810 domain-containing protein [Bacteroidota bacterium]|nr:DUF3810 domain-containing protein [Bacteroidota bacterium]